MRRIGKWLWKQAYAEYCRWLGFECVVWWEGKRFEHVAATFEGAMDWMRQYGPDTTATVGRYGQSWAGRVANTEC